MEAAMKCGATGRSGFTLAQAAAGAWDVLVVGAGPAGALAARQASLAGHAVLLVDKATFPREKVCGCCLNTAAMATLGRAGLGGLPLLLGARRLDSILLAIGTARATVLLRGGVSLSRTNLDAALVQEAVSAGASFLPRTIATLASGEGVQVSLRDAHSTIEVRPRAVVVADGLAGTLLKDRADLRPRILPGSRIGAGVILDPPAGQYPSGRITMVCGPGGYVGLVRLEDGRLDVAAAMDAAAVRSAGGPGPLTAAILDGAAMPPILGLASAHWRGTPSLTRRPARVEAEGLFLIGDAAGYVEPFTGEGMAWALASAEALMPILTAYLAGVRSRGDWTRLHRRLVGHRHRLCAAAAWGLHRPTLTRAVIGVLAAAPAAAAPFLRLVGEPWSAGTRSASPAGAEL
jgi:flavin-dependent dehydrogenase